jgi:hypothetical protein
VVFYNKREEVFMAVSGMYICDCGKHFHDTFSDDEDVSCPDCRGIEPEAPEVEFDVLKPPTMEEIAPIPFT